MKQYIFLFVLLVGSLVLRVAWLDRIPSGISGDELIYVLEAKSVAVTGRDLTGSWNPLSVLFFRYPPNELQGELPYLLNIPIASSGSLSLFTARLTSAILSTCTVLGLYFLVTQLFSARVAMVTALVAAINPWQIYIGRTAYDMVPAVCFYLWALYVMLVHKGRYLLWSIPLFILAFYSYIGTKIILFPIVFLTSVYLLKEHPSAKNKKRIAILLVTMLIFLAFFIFSLFFSSAPTRISEILQVNDPVVAQTVDAVRKVSIRSPIVDVFVNKYTITLTIIVTKLLKTLSFDFLFAHGDTFYSLYSHGLFYFVDAIFLVTGIVAMFMRYRRNMVYTCLFILVGTMPHLVHGASTENFTPHLVMMFPFLLLFIGYGISEVIHKKYVVYMIVLIYALSLGNFLQLYWFQHPLYGHFDFSYRVVSKYLQIQPKDRNLFVYSRRPLDLYKKFLFYSDSVQKENMSTIRNALTSSDIRMNNIVFLDCGNPMTIPLETTVIYETDCATLTESDEFLEISRLKDGGIEYRIYNDVVCRRYELKSYPNDFEMADLKIESLHPQAFCNTYITQ